MLLSFLLGFIVSAGEFLCTGQLFLTAILYVLHSDSTLSLRALSYLLIYTGAFLLPLVTVIAVISRTRQVLDVSEAIRKKMPLIKLCTAFAFLLLGVFILFFT